MPLRTATVLLLTMSNAGWSTEQRPLCQKLSKHCKKWHLRLCIPRCNRAYMWCLHLRNLINYCTTIMNPRLLNAISRTKQGKSSHDCICCSEVAVRNHLANGGVGPGAGHIVPAAVEARAPLAGHVELSTVFVALEVVRFASSPRKVLHLAAVGPLPVMNGFLSLEEADEHSCGCSLSGEV